MATRELLSGSITLSEAKASSANMLHRLQYLSKREAFFQRMEKHHTLLHQIVAHHLDIKTKEITIGTREHWLNGSFNLVIPYRVDLEDAAAKPEVLEFGVMRFPLPYRVGEETNPGNSDEKVNCEAATYAWIQQNCPDVPIVRLFGFGLSTNQHFTSIEYMPWWRKWLHRIRGLCRRVLGLQQPSRYLCHNGPSFLERMDIPYLLLQTVESGSVLSNTFKEKRDDPELLENLQCGLAKIMVSLASIPLPRIGSFRFDNYGYIRLDNRPLSVLFTMHENEGIPLDLPREKMFHRTDDLILQYLRAFDNRLLQQPNAITETSDAYSQMTSLSAARLVLPQLLRKDRSKGPFGLMLTDLHASNIFVDESWNVTSIIDLEFACSLPLEFLRTPFWLDGRLVDEIKQDDFESVHDGFMKHVKDAERFHSSLKDTEPISSIMRQAWHSGAFWVSLALEDPVAFTGIFYGRILGDCYSITKEKRDKLDYSFFAEFWQRNISSVVETKLEERNRYLEKLELEFANTRSESAIP